MPRKKHPKDLTTEEAVKRLFPKKARDHVDRHVAEHDEKAQVRESQRSINRKSKGS